MLMRPGTRRLHAGTDAPDTLPLNGLLLTVDGTTGRLAPSRSRCAVHQTSSPYDNSTWIEPLPKAIATVQKRIRAKWHARNSNGKVRRKKGK